MPTHLRITAKRAGFRRAGRAWPDTPTEVAVADFTEEQLEQLAAEPMLIIQPFEGDDPAADAKQADAEEPAPQGRAKPPAKPAGKAGAKDTKPAG